MHFQRIMKQMGAIYVDDEQKINFVSLQDEALKVLIILAITVNLP